MSGSWKIRGNVTITSWSMKKGCCGWRRGDSEFCKCKGGCRCGCEGCDRLCRAGK